MKNCVKFITLLTINEIIKHLSSKIDPTAEEAVIAQQIDLTPDLIKDIAYGLKTKFNNIPYNSNCKSIKYGYCFCKYGNCRFYSNS